MYENSNYTINLCLQRKIMIRAKQTYLLPPSTPITVFLITEKLLPLWLWNFQICSLVNVLWKIKHNCMMDYLCIAHLLEVERKNTSSFNFMDFKPLQTKMKIWYNENIPIINAPIEMTLNLTNSQKAK